MGPKRFSCESEDFPQRMEYCHSSGHFQLESFIPISLLGHVQKLFLYFEFHKCVVAKQHHSALYSHYLPYEKKLISSGRGNHTIMIASIGCEGTELDTKQRMTLVNKIFLINWQLNNNKTFPSEDCRGITYSKQYIELVHYWVFYWYSLSPNK